jgi:serine/threonine protein kinase
VLISSLLAARPQIVMEYCGAGSLCDLMAICDRRLSEEQIATVMKASLFGLKYLHEHKKIHRDIKSGNLLLNHAGDIKLGTARTLLCKIAHCLLFLHCSRFWCVG